MWRKWEGLREHCLGNQGIRYAFHAWWPVKLKHVVCKLLHIISPTSQPGLSYCSERSAAAAVSKNTDKDNTDDSASVNKPQKQTKPAEIKEEKVYCVLYQNPGGLSSHYRMKSVSVAIWNNVFHLLHFSLLLTSLAEWSTPRQVTQVYLPQCFWLLNTLVYDIIQTLGAHSHKGKEGLVNILVCKFLIRQLSCVCWSGLLSCKYSIIPLSFTKA